MIRNKDRRDRKHQIRGLAWLRHLAARNPVTLSGWVSLWAIVGIAGGLVAGIYWIVLEFLTHRLETFQGLSLLILMPLAGLVIGLIIHWLGNPGEIALIVDNINTQGGRIEARKNPAMILSSLVSIAAGGSAGPEAPLVQVTGSLGTWLADRLKLQEEDLRVMSLVGMASGFTALFGAPLGGAIFALEILHHQHVLEYYEAILPAVVSSCASYLVFVAITNIGIAPTWHLPQYHLNNINDFGLAVVYGVLGALLGWAFIAIFRTAKQLFHQIPGPVYLRTTIVGLILGGLAVLVPLSRYFGDFQLNTVVMTNFTPWFLLVLATVKMIAISVTFAGEWRGGFIIPRFFTGACVGKAIALLLPGLEPTLAMICVMAALNAAVTRTPVSTTLLLAKLTGFSPFTPVLFASLTGFFLAPKVPLIASQLKSEQQQLTS